ncbi:hypothetical protein [Massilia sp. BJB1822]|uniref:hypothetical protein n=1 Tax=Massilia sp. BJB1822 TaxID=2744470 RepID=UPI001593A801|nr:hypothetical protein [Massilia sp. BJB1822]NVE00701.1 hypothetical protein [Massilia sp. BJB1822]
MPIAIDARVARYIQSTPELMLLAERCAQESPTQSAAAKQFMDIMANHLRQSKTPAGDPYSRYAFKLAIKMANSGKWREYVAD